MNHYFRSLMKKAAFIIMFCLILVQCGTNVGVSSRRAARLLESADADLVNYKDDAAWRKASIAERIARENNDNPLLCKALIIKGKICDYAEISEESNRNEEALVYLQEAVYIADKDSIYPERAIARFLISEVYVNKNRWKTDSLDQTIYKHAGNWLDEGIQVAAESNDQELLNKADKFRLRYFRQGGQYEEAINVCNKIISSCSGDDYQMLHQIYDQLSILYSDVGDLEASARAHAEYSKYMQMQLKDSQSQDSDAIDMKRGYVYLLILSGAFAVVGVVIMARKHRRVKIAGAEEEVPVNQPVDKPVDQPVSQPVKETLIPDINDLTPRELDIIRLTSEGRTTSEIAEMLQISPRTVSNHKQNIYSKLGVNSSSEMLRLFESSKTGKLLK